MKVSRRLQRTIVFSFAGLYAAGALYWVSRNFLRVKGEFGDEPILLERLAGPLHLAAAFLFLFVVGMVWTQHIRPALKSREKRPSGWTFLGVLGVLAFSGVAIVYGGERLEKLSSQVHPLFGLALLPLLLLHWKLRSLRTRSVV